MNSPGPQDSNAFERQVRNMLRNDASGPGNRAMNNKSRPPQAQAPAPLPPPPKASASQTRQPSQYAHPPAMSSPPYGHPGYQGSQHYRHPDTQSYRAQFSAQPRSQKMQLDSDAFQRRVPMQHHISRQGQPPRNIFDPHAVSSSSRFFMRENHEKRAQYLNRTADTQVPAVEMSQSERNEKEAFRQTLDTLCKQVCAANSDLPAVSVECFGSFQSGFATAGSDMDLVIVVSDSTSTSARFSLLENDLPRSLERALLQAGHGARLLSRTRVPIIKVCQCPGGSLLDKLRQERHRWDMLDNEHKYPHLYSEENDVADEEDTPPTQDSQSEVVPEPPIDGTPGVDGVNANSDKQIKQIKSATSKTHHGSHHKSKTPDQSAVESTSTAKDNISTDHRGSTGPQQRESRPYPTKLWTRERKAGPLDFPKEGVGIQTDINFFNPLGLHNTQLLRCYSACDPRVRPIVLFVKAWVKKRRINSSYSGTLSSYGYVLMVLHYLVNIAKPGVLPNLQSDWRPNVDCTPSHATRAQVDDWTVDFWRNEDQIADAVARGQMSSNTESVGSLLAGFFNYYSSQGIGQQFRWMQSVLSLRTVGSGILSKEEKGWVKAATEQGEGKKIQHRYLFCIEDPFELNHNVARTVTHFGIVAIRDEFRRAHRILQAIGNGRPSSDGELFDALQEDGDEKMAQQMQTLQLQQAAAPPVKVDEAKSFNVSDKNAFPSLAAAPTTVPPAIQQKMQHPKKVNVAKQNKHAGEISGEQAKAFLEDLKKKKAIALAERPG